MTHIHIEDTEKTIHVTLSRSDFWLGKNPITAEELEKAEGGCIAVGKTVYTYGWGDECPAHDEGIHYGKGRCRKCGQTE